MMDDGKVHAFGQNEYGQLGLGDTEGHEAPAEIEGLADKEIVGVDAGGEHSLAVSAAGPVYSFGNTADGRIGRVPLQPEIPGPGNMKAVSAGDRHVLIALEDGRVFAYGHGSGGRLGHGDEYDRYEPVEIEGLPDPAENPAVSVAAGGGHSLVLLENGDVYAFGRNEYGQLGLGGGNDHLLPTRIEVLPAAVAVAAGGGHSLVLLENGGVYAFGRNEYGQLGLGDTDNREAPVKIEGLADKEIVDMDAGGEHSLVALADGSVYAFGRNEHGSWGWEIRMIATCLPSCRGCPLLLRWRRAADIHLWHWRTAVFVPSGGMNTASWVWETRRTVICRLKSGSWLTKKSLVWMPAAVIRWRCRRMVMFMPSGGMIAASWAWRATTTTLNRRG